MGNLEREAAQRTRRKNMQRIILRTVATAGLLSMAFCAPNALSVLKMFGYAPKKRDNEIILRSRARLIEQGYLRYEDGFLSLTPKGEAKLRHLEPEDSKPPIPKKWDKKWRIVIFDIQEHRKSLRDKLRNTLLLIGFKRLQHSVWIYPYDCEDLLTLLKVDYKVGRNVLYMIADAVEHDRPLKKHFNLD